MVIILIGVSGSGKTTIGELLADSLDAVFLDADDFHSVNNRIKMQQGVPLTDEDRSPWLQAIARELQTLSSQGERVVLACSALREQYRDVMRQAVQQCSFVWLDAPEPVLRERMRGRHHFFPASLLESQLAAFEPPTASLRVDATRAPAIIIRSITEWLTQQAGVG